MASRFVAIVLVLTSWASTYGGITFTPGHFYSSNYFDRSIMEYDSAGNVVGTLTIPTTAADEIRGLSFGPDGLLYATAIRGSGFAVLAMNSAGAIQQTYPANVYAFGNLSFGKLAVDGQHVYVAAQNVVTRFDVGNPGSGTPIYSNNQLYDVKILPNGDLLAASAYEVNEITNSGALVRPLSLGIYTDVRGVEYNSATNKLFVTHLGHTGFFDRIMRIDATTLTLETNTTFNYADDLFLTDTGNLLVGSRTGAPRFYNQDLVQMGTLGTAQRMFVTEYVVPEPTGTSSALIFISCLLVQRFRRETCS